MLNSEKQISWNSIVENPQTGKFLSRLTWIYLIG
jgi:hypothetical protein